MNSRFSYFKNYFRANNEKAAVFFLLKLLILLSLLKLVFYFYNAPVLGTALNISVKNIFVLLKWSLYYDALVLLFINTPFLVLLVILSFFKKKIPAVLITVVFLLANFIGVLLNLVDVFYFHFHLQRADADLLYVIQHPFQTGFSQHLFAAFFGIVAIAVLFYLLLRIHKKLLTDHLQGSKFFMLALVMFISCVLFIKFQPKKIVPTYPLTELNSAQLQIVENSLHSFAFSLYRKREGMVHPYHFLPDTLCDKLFTASEISYTNDYVSSKKNIVLFIMESIPEDFFHTSGKYKVAMPFFDSLVKQSTYFSNAYSYSHNSNKGITAILAGIPTLTEIPLYHSNYATLKTTAIGTALAASGYSSSFFIGDEYDDYGFAKCCNWLGIQHYYSKEAIPGYQNMENHTLGLHDQYVLDFMGNTINTMHSPFFAVNYNISTHFPNDLPKNYNDKFPDKNFLLEMKSMNYYNECLQQFFAKASTQSWYNNTVFIFCSDHWMYPDARSLVSDVVQDFHIPIIIFDPAQPQQKMINSPVSQLDILNTVLCIAGIKATVISYGNSLLDNNLQQNRTVFCKENSTLYQAIDSSYVLGFNAVTGKAEFCYNYKTDIERKTNLVGAFNPVVDSLSLKMKAFLQTASYHYNKLGTYRVKH